MNYNASARYIFVCIHRLLNDGRNELLIEEEVSILR